MHTTVGWFHIVFADSAYSIDPGLNVDFYLRFVLLENYPPMLLPELDTRPQGSESVWHLY